MTAGYHHEDVENLIVLLAHVGKRWVEVDAHGAAIDVPPLLAMLRDLKERLIGDDSVEAIAERLRAQLAEQFKGMLATYGEQSEALEAIARALGGEMDAGGFFDQTGRKVFTIRELPAAVGRALRDPTEMDGTDGAHPAWWRGHDDGAKGVARALYLVAAHGRCHEARFSDHAVERAAAEIEQLRLDAVTWNRYALTYRTRWQEALAEVAQALAEVALYGRCHGAQYSYEFVERAAWVIGVLRSEFEAIRDACPPGRAPLAYIEELKADSLHKRDSMERNIALRIEAEQAAARLREEAAEARAEADRVRRVVSGELTGAVKEAERLRAELENRGKVNK